MAQYIYIYIHTTGPIIPSITIIIIIIIIIMMFVLVFFFCHNYLLLNVDVANFY